MSYEKTNWQDSILQFPSRFSIDNVSSGIVDISRSAGTVTQEGTIQNADNMNNIEGGVALSNQNINYKSTTHSGNNFTCTLSETLVDGAIVRFISPINTNKTAVTLNSIPVYLPNSITAPIIYANQQVILCYDAPNSCFYEQISSEGNALITDVLSGIKFSTASDLNLTGTMPNNGSVNYAITTSGGTHTLPVGYNTGGTITAPTLAALTNSASVTAASQIKNGYIGYSKGNRYVGTNSNPDANRNVIGSVTINSGGAAAISGLSVQPYLGLFFSYNKWKVYSSNGFDGVVSQIYDPNHIMIPRIDSSQSSANAFTHFTRQKANGVQNTYGETYRYFDNRISYSGGTLSLTGYNIPELNGGVLEYILFIR